MTQPNRYHRVGAAAALLLATWLPALAWAATPRSHDPARAQAPRAQQHSSAAQRLSPVLEFLARTVTTEAEPAASPHVPPGPPPDRPPAIPPGQDNPPNPPGQPPDRPPFSLP
jgi:hypothetical protein